MNDKEEVVDNRKCKIPSFFLADVMKLLSELECSLWDVRQDKVRIQNILIALKSELMTIDKNNRDIITVNGLKYKRSYDD